ncbi:HD domain-containing protein, partial [Clostridium perfringens]|uniref:HD domain-containing protein n=2 Tax=Clostridium TaxID=1485 RepID=UPI002ACEA481
MENVNKILNHTKYKELLDELNELEKEREFCNHTLEHFLDVARIAYIDVLEKGLNYNKEIIYSIALLHDIGRVLQYNEGIDHHEGSAIIALEILKET